MADVSIFDVSGGGNDAKATALLTAGAAAQTVPCAYGKDQRLALRVKNGNELKKAVVCVAAGSGPRAALGAMSVTVNEGETAYIALFDTARYKDLSTNGITVTLVDAAGDALEAAELAAVQIEAVQL
ncbi:MAG: hypothetical protein ACOX8Q_06320 [Christensenellales bacterium]|jgi:hypothetical protein